ncbi:JmjC domain-containing protein [Streptomyces sp. NPDC093097]|uniref:JmjC domain-containing protein n=1 Tax=Streptomyces sp. NPDC093097 TaxID=3366027 RepID=UPI0038038236
MHPPTRIDPLRVDVEAPPPPEGEPVAEIVLRAGDMLYLPRGWWHAVNATEGRSLHLTCGLTPTTGADLLTWLTDQLRASATVRANLPTHAPRKAQLAHLAALLKEFTAGLHEGVIEEFLAARGTMDPGRPTPSLPYVDGIPAETDLLVRLTASGAWYEVDDEGRLVMGAGGQHWTLAATALTVIKSLTEGRSLSLGELAVASQLSVGQIASLATELVTADVAAVSHRR